MKSDKRAVLVITFPSSYGTLAPTTPILNLLAIFKGLGLYPCIISGGYLISALSNKDESTHVTHIVARNFFSSSNLLVRIFNFILVQLEVLNKMLVALLNLNAKLIFFILGGEILVLPVAMARFLGKKVLFLPGGSATETHRALGDPLFKFLRILQGISLYLANGVILYSPRMVKGKLKRHSHKVIIAHEHFIDFNIFKKTRELSDRPNLVGYVGRLSREKGVLNFVKAIPLVLKKCNTVRFIICGEGKLYDCIEDFLKRNNLEGYVKLLGWIPHDHLPYYLNEMKLLVLPSFSEGLPNIVLEAMACGTPVLATRVGAIPEIIKDKKTGFILESSNPKCIANKIVSVLEKPELLANVSINAYKFVKSNFNFKKTVECWKKIFKSLS